MESSSLFCRTEKEGSEPGRFSVSGFSGAAHPAPKKQ